MNKKEARSIIGKSLNYSVVDLFCGVGGLTNGFIQAGFNVTAGIDLDDSCQYAYERNNNSTFHKKDLGQVEPMEIEDLFQKGTRKILVGCAPCQPFSIFNRKNKGNLSDLNSERWKLLYSFSSLINKIQPEVISMENVPLLKNFQNGDIFSDFIKNLEDQEYHVYYEICDAKNYGVPQRRKRLVLLASKLGPINLISPNFFHKHRTVRDAISHLPKIESGETCALDPLHKARKLNDLSLKRIRATPEGGSWKDWEENLIAECHKREGGKAFGSAYGRMLWDDVAPTMTTYCVGYNNGKFGHPDQDRAISLREAALLQSFPEDYEFWNPDENFSSANIARHIGNAVPVLLGKAIAESIRQHIEKTNND